jgi:hypothetical protein
MVWFESTGATIPHFVPELLTVMQDRAFVPFIYKSKASQMIFGILLVNAERIEQKSNLDLFRRKSLFSDRNR